MLQLRMLGILLLFGTVLFQIAAFHPVTRVFIEPDAEKSMEIIRSKQKGWDVSQWMFSIGSLVVAVALGLFVLKFGNARNLLIGYSGFGLILVGAVLWTIHCMLRYQYPQAFVAGTQPAWHFIAYTLLTMAGMILIGIFMLGTEIKSWVGWTLILGNVAFLVLFLVFKDMPPFVYYVLTLIAGIMMIL